MKTPTDDETAMNCNSPKELPPSEHLDDANMVAENVPSSSLGPVGDNDEEEDGKSEDDRLKTLEDVVLQQKDKLNYYQRQLAINEHKYLTDVGSLQSQLQSSNKMCDVAKHEKEAAFMRYVLKEKEILDLNTEKRKLSDTLKERDKQIARFKANSEELAKCIGAIETKNKEIREYKALVDSLNEEKARVLKDLDHMKTRYEHDTKCSHETENKRLCEIQELQNKLELLTKENKSFNEESNLERIVLNSRLYINSIECTKQQSQKMEQLQSVIEELNGKLTECTCMVNSLENENIDLKTHMESCEIKTNEMLVFTENLSSRNASLQSECNNLKTVLDKVKSDCDILKQKNIDLKTAFKVQNDNITKKKELYDCDKKELASHLALKMRMIADLKNTLERTQDDLHVTKRKFKTTVTGLSKELQKKNIVDVSVEMKMVLDKMVKLQQENARICEKLDFVENHNKHLMYELKKKNSIMQKHRPDIQ